MMTVKTERPSADAREIERLLLENRILKDACQVFLELVDEILPQDLDSDAAVARCAVKRLQEALGHAGIRLLKEAPGGQFLYGGYVRQLAERAYKAEERLAQMEDAGKLSPGTS